MSEEQPQPSEGQKEPELEPLKPLEPDIVTAMTRLMESPSIEVTEPIISAEIPHVSYRRRMVPLSNEVCPHGLAGFCLVCPRCPCDYLKARTLRAMITELNYGK